MNSHHFYLKTKGEKYETAFYDLALLLVCSGSLCLAQTEQSAIKEDFNPSTLNQPGQQYPRSTPRVRTIPHCSSKSSKR